MGIQTTSVQVIAHLGVFWYCSKALQSLSPSKYLPFQAARMIFFIDFTVASALLLLWG